MFLIDLMHELPNYLALICFLKVTKVMKIMKHFVILKTSMHSMWLLVLRLQRAPYCTKQYKFAQNTIALYKNVIGVQWEGKKKLLVRLT